MRVVYSLSHKVLAVIFCGFISHLTGHKTISIPEIFSDVQGFRGKTVTSFLTRNKQIET